MKYPLYLGTQSQSRQKLLKQACIPYTLVSQSADETQCDWGMPLEQLVLSIAKHKMNHVILPEGKEGDICFVLTADTLSYAQGKVRGKPSSKEDAIDKIKAAREGSTLFTGFILQKRRFQGGTWVVEQEIARAVGAEFVYDVPDHLIEWYLENTPHYMKVGGAISIGGFGLQFLGPIRGSFSTIIGLPLYEVRQALIELGFFS